MADQAINGVPIQFNDHRVVKPEDKSELEALFGMIEEQIKELTGLGVTVNRVLASSLPEPPKFYISFNHETPMFKTRLELEKELWDVGNDMGQGGKNISFYATKRVTKTEGWQV